MNKVFLMILDGYSLGKPGPGNAVHLADTPVLDRLYATYPWTFLKACGEAVGLPEGQMGNSEVGHLNLGAGRVVMQDILRISKAVREESLGRIPALMDFFAGVRKRGGRVHLVGLLSHGGVHSLQEHLNGLVEEAEKAGLDGFVHAILDGRDTLPTSGYANVEECLAFLKGHPDFHLASIVGRYYTMDRDKRWERIRKGYDLIVRGVGKPTNDPVAAVRASYEEGVGDEFVKPIVVTQENDSVAKLRDGDGILFFNFRSDRMRQIVRALFDETFNGFDRGSLPDILGLTMTRYHPDFPLPVLFPPVVLHNILAQVLADHGLKNLRIAETEKYAHVTFFFNGGEDRVFPGEERILVPSPKVATYDLQPEMSAEIVTKRLIEVGDAFPVVILNFANCDMVGHTGIIPAAVKAVETVDTSLGRILNRFHRPDTTILVTADHGNAEEMLDEKGNVLTQHSLNPVPLITVNDGLIGRSLREGGALKDVAPTILELLGIDLPPEMTGRSLLIP